MRVSNSMISRSAVERVQENLGNVEKARDRVVTGLRVQRPSDDPIAADRIMETTTDLRANAQYQRNIERGRHRAETEERALDGLTNLIARAREIATQQGSATSGATGRAVAAEEAKGLMESAIALGNTRFGDTFLFGGGYVMSAPFAANGTTSTTQPPTGSHMVEVDDGHLAETNHDGETVFMTTGAMSSLQGLEAALLSGNPAAIAGMTGALDVALDNIQELIGEVGVRAQVFEVARTSREDEEVSLLEMRSSVRDIDLDQAITELLGHQSALDAAILAISRAQSSSLVDRL